MKVRALRLCLKLGSLRPGEILLAERSSTETPGPGDGWASKVSRGAVGRRCRERSGSAVPAAAAELGWALVGRSSPRRPFAWPVAGVFGCSTRGLCLPPWDVHCAPARTVWERTRATSCEDALRYDFIRTYSGASGKKGEITE